MDISMFSFEGFKKYCLERQNEVYEAESCEDYEPNKYYVIVNTSCGEQNATTNLYKNSSYYKVVHEYIEEELLNTFTDIYPIKYLKSTSVDNANQEDFYEYVLNIFLKKNKLYKFYYIDNEMGNNLEDELKEKVEKYEKEIEELKEKNKLLEEHIACIPPDGALFLEAQADFQKLQLKDKSE
jgi:hypothetical protein